MPDNDAGNRLEITINEETRKVFEKIRYIFDLKNHQEVLEQGIAFLLTYIKWVERGYSVLIPAKKVGDKLQVLADKKGVGYLFISKEDLERLLYWKQMQDIYKDFKKDGGNKKS